MVARNNNSQPFPGSLPDNMAQIAELLDQVAYAQDQADPPHIQWVWGYVDNDDPWNDGPELLEELEPLPYEMGTTNAPWAVIEIAQQNDTGVLIIWGIMRNGRRVLVEVSRHNSYPLGDEVASEAELVLQVNPNTWVLIKPFMGGHNSRMNPNRFEFIDLPNEYNNQLSPFGYTFAECAIVFMALNGAFTVL